MSTSELLRNIKKYRVGVLRWFCITSRKSSLMELFRYFAGVKEQI